MHPLKLDDSPMFRQQIQSLEESNESFRSRCLKFHKGCRKYMEALMDQKESDIAFASSLETFLGSRDDPLYNALGGPVIRRVAAALREIGRSKDFLLAQIEHNLCDKLLHFTNFDLNDAKAPAQSDKMYNKMSKLDILQQLLLPHINSHVRVQEARKRFDKASVIYDQAHEKFLSLKKSTRMDVAAVINEEHHGARSFFEHARFNLVSALSTVEGKKRFEFVEALSGTAVAHLQYFEQGYEMLRKMDPLIKKMLASAQQSRESCNYEQAALIEKMHEYKDQIDRECKMSGDVLNSSVKVDTMQKFARNSPEVTAIVKETIATGQVQIIRQGYLSKHSSNLRGDWKRRFFILDSQGMLRYYRKPWSCVAIPGSPSCAQKSTGCENGSRPLSRWLSSHYHGGGHDEMSGPQHTVNLMTSTIKIDADETDLRFCFRIISPSKSYTLQAENALDQMDWIEKISGVITSLLSFQATEGHVLASAESKGGASGKLGSSHGVDEVGMTVDWGQRHAIETDGRAGRGSLALKTQPQTSISRSPPRLSSSGKPADVLRSVLGNDRCADCGALAPDWASLNLGILMCIECSGIHRNLGVHISKVRSLTLDVKAWEPSVITLFESLGNAFANSVWEELLQPTASPPPSPLHPPDASDGTIPGNKTFHIRKPTPGDPTIIKEIYILAKYAEKLFLCKAKDKKSVTSLAEKIWDEVQANDKKAVYRHVINLGMDVNSIPRQVRRYSSSVSFPKLDETIPYEELVDDGERLGLSSERGNGGHSSHEKQHLLDHHVQATYDDAPNLCPLLHLACQGDAVDIAMVELLLQYGADVNAVDSMGRTALHHCIIKRRIAIAKLLLARGACPSVRDREGMAPLQMASKSGFDDPEVLALLT